MNLLHWRPLGAVLAALSMLSGCGQSTSAASSAEQQPASAQKTGRASAGNETNTPDLKLGKEALQTAGVKVSVLQEQAISGQVVVTASIQANQDKLARVAARVPGRIAKVMANLGAGVKAGQALALIDSIEVGEAQSAYAQAASEQALAKANFDRAQKLYAEQIISQKDYLRARSDFEKAKAVLRAASEKRQALGIAGRNSAASSVASVFAVSAPFAGTVIDKAAVLGELAQADKPLFTVADLSTVWIVANLYEKDLGKVRLGAPAAVSTTAYPDATFQGKVTYISSVMDKESRTAKAIIEVPNRDQRLKLDMFATAAIDTGGYGKALLLPEDAVVLVQGQPTVFVQVADGFDARAVELGDKLQGRVVVKAGIRPGEKVVTAGAFALKATMLKSQISAD